MSSSTGAGAGDATKRASGSFKLTIVKLMENMAILINANSSPRKSVHHRQRALCCWDNCNSELYPCSKTVSTPAQMERVDFSTPSVSATKVQDLDSFALLDLDSAGTGPGRTIRCRWLLIVETVNWSTMSERRMSDLKILKRRSVTISDDLC